MAPTQILLLQKLAQQAASETPHVPGELAAVIRATAAGPADPWPVIGVLVEGLVHTIRTALPPERQHDCVVATIQMLIQRTNMPR